MAVSSISQTPNAHTARLCSAVSGHTLKELQAKNNQLRAEIKALPWPRLSSFEVNGNVYPLPQKIFRKSLEIKQVPREELQYLAGFFDGDGCAMPTSDLSGCQLFVSQSYRGAAVLYLFLTAVGGSIRNAQSGAGLHEPVLQWSVFGQQARLVASMLAPLGIVKKTQLEIAMHWPVCKSTRHEAALELAFCKHIDSACPSDCSWPYFAGFFDAEGNIGQFGHSQSLRLSIKQKHITVLDCLRAFLLSELRLRASVNCHLEMHALRIDSTSKSKIILQKMLDAGLVRKAEQAKLALKLCAGNVVQTRHALQDLVGNQGFGKRLDKAGLARAAKIRKVRQRARYAMQKGWTDFASSMLEEVECLMPEHAMLNAKFENILLCNYIHRIRAMHC